MERVSIREASIRLRLSQANIRECISQGELRAFREPGLNGRLTWVVELPEEGWTSAAMAVEEEREVFPWWWSNVERTGEIHYVEEINVSVYEEIVPKFLCGITGDNMWVVQELLLDSLCPDCLATAKDRGLPLSLED
jgi:hypothetical protein